MKLKKLLLLADPVSAHTIKWANELSKYFSVIVCGFSNGTNFPDYLKGIEVINFRVNNNLKLQKDGSLKKILYLKFIFAIKKIIDKKKPDILHSHYATSYGLLGKLTGFHPYFISVWGSDVVEFPKNFVFKLLLKNILSSADYVFATSNDLAKVTKNYYKKEIRIIPFGIDTQHFNYVDRNFEEGYIGIVKTLAPNYGIEFVIRAYEIVKKRRKNFNYKLLIVGGGLQLEELTELTEKLGIRNETTFTGFVNYSEINKYHQKINIGIFPSFKESFGVAIAEFMSTGGATIATNVGGIKEIVDDQKNGFLVETANVNKIAEYIEFYLDNINLTKEMCLKAREKIVNTYSLEECGKKMKSYYYEVI